MFFGMSSRADHVCYPMKNLPNLLCQGQTAFSAISRYPRPEGRLPISTFAPAGYCIGSKHAMSDADRTRGKGQPQSCSFIWREASFHLQMGLVMEPGQAEEAEDAMLAAALTERQLQVEEVWGCVAGSGGNLNHR